jgi:hypothetical protein
MRRLYPDFADETLDEMEKSGTEKQDKPGET